MKTMHVLLEEQAKRYVTQMETGGVISITSKILKHPLAIQMAALVTDELRQRIIIRTPAEAAKRIEQSEWLGRLQDFQHCLVEFRDHDVAITMD